MSNKTFTNKISPNNASITLNGITYNTSALANGSYLTSTSASTMELSQGISKVATATTDVNIGLSSGSTDETLITVGSTSAEWQMINTSNIRRVRVGTVNNIDITTLNDGVVIDGITLNTDDRVLVKNQTNAILNGIYTVAGAGGGVRSPDVINGKIFNANLVFIEEGNIEASNGYIIPTGTVGIDPLNFRLFGNTVLVNNSLGLSALSGVAKKIILMPNTYTLDSNISLNSSILEGSGIGNTIINRTASQFINATTGNCVIKRLTLNVPINIIGGALKLLNAEITENVVVSSNGRINIDNCKIIDSIINVINNNCSINNCRFIENITNNDPFIILNFVNSNLSISNCFVDITSSKSAFVATLGTINIKNCIINFGGTGELFIASQGIFNCQNLHITSNKDINLNNNHKIIDSTIDLMGNTVNIIGDYVFLSSNRIINSFININNLVERPIIINNTANSGSVNRFISVNNSNRGTNTYMSIIDNNFTRSQDKTITGTSISFTNGSNNITGIGTTFTTDLTVGDTIGSRNSNPLVISSITDDTNLTSTSSSNETATVAPVDLLTNVQINAYENVIDLTNTNSAVDCTFTLPDLGLGCVGHTVLVRWGAGGTESFRVSATSRDNYEETGNSWTSIILPANDSYCILRWNGINGWYLIEVNNATII